MGIIHRMKFASLLLPLLVFVVLVSTRSPDVSRGVEQQFRFDVGGTEPGKAPPASLAVWVNEPAAGTRIRGTVLCLHGFMANHQQVGNAGEALRKAGYRVVLLDARGFGESTGSHFTFGVTDSRDLSQVISELQQRGLCGKTVGVYGTSMGAATAILLAADDPRITTVVAVAPFASIREEVTPFSRNVLGSIGSFLSDSVVNSMADMVSNVAGMDLDTARPIDAITRTKAKILLIHGDKDTIIPHEASVQLHAENPATKLLTIPNRGHLALCFDVPGELQPVTRKWFDEHLAPK